ncbi:prepilin-type N-terminal cleavage/methylation domain-containing protein [Patescibacteria group bacterium]|nr:prepilin-type N-terminal cleavage/methylation domain-containing protein [Patescibacteria group bacterium]
MFNRKGFTLIELMIVVVILGLLAAIAIPNFISMQNRAMEAKTKGVCHTVQLAVEDYVVRNDGRYPEKVVYFLYLLPAEQLLENAFTNQVTEPRDAIMTDEVPGPGQVFYQPIKQGNINIGYVITGYGADSQQIVELTSGS